MKYLKKFNEASFDRIEEFIKLVDKIINYDESEFEQGDEPSKADILSELGDLCNELTFTSEEIQQVIELFSVDSKVKIGTIKIVQK